jgi:hypothetical protein
MQASEQSVAMRELESLIGRQIALDQVHGVVRRTARGIERGLEYGVCLVSCSDEFQGELRSRFDRDVARPLSSPTVVGTRSVFSLSNLGARLEPGAVAVANDHFTVESRREGAKLLLVKIAAHVGMRTQDHETIWGEVDRCGQPSPCCAALGMVITPPAITGAVRYPWLEDLQAAFGPRRIEALRTESGPFRMVKAALIHAVLQAETAVTDLFRAPPPTETHILVVPIVVIDQQGPEDAIVAGVHHLFAKGGNLDIVHGAALRTTPQGLEVESKSGRLRVTSTEDAPAPPIAASGEGTPAPSPGARQQLPEVVQHLDGAREELRSLQQRPHLARIYARPLLRGMIQGLSLVAPKIALEAMAIQGSRAALRTRRLRNLLASGPSTDEARGALHHVEAELQQLGHREAQELLQLLTAENSPLFR